VNDADFDFAVEQLMTVKVTSPGYVIVGGLSGNQGVVIARDFESTDHTAWLDDDAWFVVQTNRDVWTEFEDTRFNAAVKNMNAMGQQGVTLDGVVIIESVLW
jgi:hypothetical protein